ncbi:MAG: IS4 family transposase [Lentisphaerota bacterium]
MNRCSSLFSQMLGIVSRGDFSRKVKEFGTDRNSKGFSSWDQFVSMLFCQMAQAKSLREICGGLKSCLGKLVHLGVGRTPSKSNLSYSNKNRSWELYEAVFYDLLRSCRSSVPWNKKKFRFKNKLYSLDATVIDLCLSLYDWAKYKTTKGAVKLHMLLDHDIYLPTFVNITDGKVHEVNIAKMLNLPKGSIVAMDMGYNDYGMFYDWTMKCVWFVTRMKGNAKYRVVSRSKTPSGKKNILSDEIIEFTCFYARKDCSVQLRRVTVWNEEKSEEMVFLTNNMKLAASTIASIYKERWQIEIFFKMLKQNLKVKTFVGTSANAVKIQIWTALIALLLIKYLQFKARFAWSLSNLVAMLRWNLFTYRDIWEWLDNPFCSPPEEEYEQPELPLLDSIWTANRT